MDVKKISRELGVRYLLEGSVRRADDKVRINAQLIDATTGGHLWADRYDGNLGDIFALQDSMTAKIVSALALKLTADEQEHMARKETDNIEAYDAFLKGWAHYLRFTPDDFAKAVSYFEKAIKLDPNYGRAYAALALAYWRGSNLGWTRKLFIFFAEARLRVRPYLQRAMKNPTSIAHGVSSSMALFMHQHEEAIAEAERAIALDPNDADSHGMMARALIMAGRPEESISFLKRMMLLDPHNPSRPLGLLGMAHFCMGQLEEAVTLIERALAHNPELREFAAPLAATYAHLHRDQEARAALDSYRKGYDHAARGTLVRAMSFWPFRDPEVADRFANGLLKAGLTGQPSGYYKLSEEHELTGEEIKVLVFGRKMYGGELVPSDLGLWRIHRTKDGKATYVGQFVSDSGRSWIEGDMLCDQWQKHFGGLKYCSRVFRNPEGTRQEENEYLLIRDFGIARFSPVD
ncbi:MAG: tetratricopeptide repeat protein [Proteobacteria bacterium]|nr:tetratricopeptide repeat protein [Pseudomonadota bacterium]